LQSVGDFQLGIYFVKRNVVDSVHKLWTNAGHGPWWTDHHGQPWSSLELGLGAAPGHGDSLQGGKMTRSSSEFGFGPHPRWRGGVVVGQ
jgi:hypothetical protein